MSHGLALEMETSELGIKRDPDTNASIRAQTYKINVKLPIRISYYHRLKIVEGGGGGGYKFG